MSDLNIPLADPLADNAPYRAEIDAAIRKVVDSGRYILGPEVAQFESALAAAVHTTGAVGVGSGTDAIVLALLAAGVGVGDEVLTVSHTAGPSVAAIRMIGAIPVLVDVEDETYCIDVAQLQSAWSPKVKALLAVHLYGHPADIVALKAFCDAHGVALIEDCAQAQGALYHGAPVGSFGRAACFSFFPTKNLGAIGDGGAVASSDAAILNNLRMLRTYGWSVPQYSSMADGRCSRLDELQAAILSVKLAGLNSAVEARRRLAAHYRDGLRGLPLVLPIEKAGCEHAYHLFVVRTKVRPKLIAYLSSIGIVTGIHYPYPVHAQPGLASGARISSNLAVTDRIAPEILSLPFHTTLSLQSADRVIEALRNFFKSEQ